MPRTGAFAVSLSTPKCDDLEDYIDRYLNRAANYSVDFLERTGAAIGDTFSGNPGALVDWANEGWQDLKTATVWVFSEGIGVLILEETFRYLLPGSGIADFINEGRQVTGYVLGDVLVGGTMEVFEDNVADVSHDLWNVIENIDDPAGLAAALGDKFQKWTPAGALTYIFTESDPLKGAEKAATRIYQQAEILTLYIAPYAKAPAGMVNNSSRAWRAYNKLAGLPKGFPGPKLHHFGMGTEGSIKKHIQKALTHEILDQGKKVMEQLKPEQQEAYATLLALVKLRVEEGAVTGEHPFYSASRIAVVPAQLMGDNYKDQSSHKWGLWHPIVENDSDCISLGDWAIADRGGHLTGTKLRAICGAKDPNEPSGYEIGVYEGPLMRARGTWWDRPIDYQLVWGDNCSGGRHNRSIWAPVCPEGYTGVGFVAWGESSQKPLPNRIACLQNDPQLMHWVDGATAGLAFRTDDRGSGAKYDVTIYQRRFGGIEVMYAAPGYTGSMLIDPSTVQVPVTWGVPSAELRAWDATPNGVDPPFAGGIWWTTPLGYEDPDAQSRFEARQRKLDTIAAAAMSTRVAANTNTAQSGWQIGPEPDPSSTTFESWGPTYPRTSYTHEVFLHGDQQNRYFVGSEGHVVMETPAGTRNLVGKVNSSQDSRFASVIYGTNTWFNRAFIDASGNIWMENANGLYAAGGIRVLQSNPGLRPPASNPTTTPSTNPTTTPSTSPRGPTAWLQAPVYGWDNSSFTFQVNGQIQNAYGAGAQLILHFYYNNQGNWAQLIANRQMGGFHQDSNGMVATYVDFQVQQNPYDVGAHPVVMPFEAFNLPPRNGRVWQLMTKATVFVNGVPVAESPPANFELQW